ncbi:MAG: hypothetical protein DHS80DRAFT_29664 [Piptocephalis tieghemiana]|nr:MAG: hypothetical protein DHS80DRAFT_33342 [Piptocephalis tieghemiana]KAI9229657.1 MAG: hypothetical protein DHS80DRAFT_29664 [Piptocephalis tieghemiana]
MAQSNIELSAPSGPTAISSSAPPPPFTMRLLSIATVVSLASLTLAQIPTSTTQEGGIIHAVTSAGGVVTSGVVSGATNVADKASNAFGSGSSSSAEPLQLTPLVAAAAVALGGNALWFLQA